MMASGEIRLFTTMSRQMPVLAQSQTCSSCGTVWSNPNDIEAEVTVTAQSTSPALFLGGMNSFFAPAGTDLQGLQQLGRQFAAQGLTLKQFKSQIVKNPAINMQLISQRQGLGYGFYQDAANFAVGAVSEGYFDGNDVGLAAMSVGGQWYGFWNSTDWSFPMVGYWQRWWDAGWNAASSGNFPVQVGPPLQMSFPVQ